MVSDGGVEGKEKRGRELTVKMMYFWAATFSSRIVSESSRR